MYSASRSTGDEQQMIWHICFKADTLSPTWRGYQDEPFASAQISLIDVACCQRGRVERRASAACDALRLKIDRQRNRVRESRSGGGDRRRGDHGDGDAGRDNRCEEETANHDVTPPNPRRAHI